jgi:hypothetical protein
MTGVPTTNDCSSHCPRAKGDRLSVPVSRLFVQLECQAVARAIFYKFLILLRLGSCDLAEARCETTFVGKNSDCTQNTPRENPLERVRWEVGRAVDRADDSFC